MNQILKNKKILFFTVMAFLFLLTSSLTYAYFSANVSGNDSATLQYAKAGTLSLFYQDGPQIEMVEILPGESVEKTIIVENTGTLTAQYDIKWIDFVNTIKSNELHFSLECTSYLNYGESDQEISGTCPNETSKSIGESDITLKKGVSINSGITHKYIITLEFVEIGEQQNYNQGQAFHGTLNITDATAVCEDNQENLAFVNTNELVDETTNFSTYVCINEESNININNTKYIVSRYYENFGINSSQWENSENFTSTSQNVFNNNLGAGLYYIHVLTETNDGAKEEVISSGIGVEINQQKRVNDLTALAANLASTNQPIINSNKISYDFIQLWKYFNSSYDEILKTFLVLKRAEYTSVIVVAPTTIEVSDNAIHIKSQYYDSSVTGYIKDNDFSNIDNVLDLIFTAANEVGIDVYLGTTFYNDWYDEVKFKSQSWVDLVNEYTIKDIDELYSKYGDNESYKGWYYSNEMYTNNSNYENDWINILSDVIDHINTLENRGNLIFSPFLSYGMHTETSTIENNFSNLISSLNFRSNDIISIQDAYGTSKYPVEMINERINAMRNAVKSSNPSILFYSNIENFASEGEGVIFDRVKKQIEIAEYVSDGLLSFSYVHYFSPFSGNVNNSDKYYYDKLYRAFIGQNPLDESPITIIPHPQDGYTYVDSNGDEAPIPSGFTVSSVASERIINNGLVIKDNYENEFVWVPVKYGIPVNGITYDNSNYDGAAYYRTYSENPSNLTTDTLPLGVTSENHQIEKYKGFYIGRYESSNYYENNTQTLSIKKTPNDIYANTSFYYEYANYPMYNGYIMLNINYPGAKTMAESMSSAYEYHSSVKTGMITGTQWDTAARWIETKDYTKYKHYQGYEWGNYSDSISPANSGNYESTKLKGTGSNEAWKARNIYDFAGNLREWNSEYDQNHYYSLRDNSYKSGGQYFGPTITISTASYAFDDVGIRVILYLE